MTPSGGSEDEAATAGTQRLDKWLWFARVIKSRTAAAELVSSGKVRLNKSKALKPSATVRIGDVVTVVAHRRLRVLEVRGLGQRRGSPAEAAALFQEVSVHPPAETGDT